MVSNYIPKTQCQNVQQINKYYLITLLIKLVWSKCLINNSSVGEFVPWHRIVSLIFIQTKKRSSICNWFIKLIVLRFCKISFDILENFALNEFSRLHFCNFVEIWTLVKLRFYHRSRRTNTPKENKYVLFYDCPGLWQVVDLLETQMDWSVYSVHLSN
jgi:hypothetical protein